MKERGQHPAHATTTDTRRECRHEQPDTTQQSATATGIQASTRRARLAARAQPRPGDSPHTAALRAMLRDETLMAEVTANVDSWPEPTEQQRQAIAALWHRPTA